MTELLFGPGMLFLNAVLGGALIALVCSLLGVYLVLRRMVLLGIALPQAGAAGIAAALWITSHGHDPDAGHTSALLGSAVATFGAIGLLMVAQRGRSQPAEWRVGVLFAVASAATMLFVALNPSGDLEVTNMLRGHLLAISDADLSVLAGASAAALLLFAAFRREILLASFDPEFATTVGRRPERADALLFGLLGGAIALGVKEAGPLVVFGFLVLPALTALRLAPGLGSAFVVAAVVGVACSVGGFEIAYRADLPTGPTSVALAAGCWVLALVGTRVVQGLRRNAASRSAAVSLLLVVGLGFGGPVGCGRGAGNGPGELAPLPRGSFPELAGNAPVTVARFANATGEALRLPVGNPLREAQRAVGAGSDPAWTVTDALQAQAVMELARREVPVASFDVARQVLPDVPSGPGVAARHAREAGVAGPVLFGRLERFTVTQTGLLLVRMQLALIEPATGALLWTASAHKPVPIRSALSPQEILVDAAPAIFAQAFENGSVPPPASP